MGDQSLFKIDVATQNGQAIPFEDGTAMLNGAARYSAQAHLASSGPDYESYRREPCTLEMNVMVGRKLTIEDLRNIRNARFVLKDMNGPQRVLLPNVSFGTCGPVGSGPVKVTFNVLEAPQWL